MRHVAHYGIGMIRSIRHKGLKRFFEDDDPKGVNPEHGDEVRDILATLHATPWLLTWIYRGSSFTN